MLTEKKSMSEAHFKLIQQGYTRNKIGVHINK